MHLHEHISAEVRTWRSDDYTCAYPAVAEIFDWARETETGVLRFLREPQLRALETYWYLRLARGTTHVFDLYREAFPKPRKLLRALGLDRQEILDYVVDNGIEALWERLRNDDDFVTNTEKIRIQKETIRKTDLGLFAGRNEDETRAEVANLRLQAIASLPHLAVFSDEAHHTYGQSLETGLKKVRRTVDYLARLGLTATWTSWPRSLKTPGGACSTRSPWKTSWRRSWAGRWTS